MGYLIHSWIVHPSGPNTFKHKQTAPLNNSAISLLTITIKIMPWQLQLNKAQLVNMQPIAS